MNLTSKELKELIRQVSKEVPVTSQQYAKRYNLHPKTVSKWCREGKLDAEKIGRTWYISKGY